MIQPLITAVPEKRMVRLMSDFKTPYGTVPGWFLFDGASIPPAAQRWTYTPFDPAVLAASAWHDYVYLTHQYSRAEADQQFHDLVVLNYGNAFKAHMMLSALQSAGWMFWENTEADKVRMMLMYQVCRDRGNFKDYGFPEWCAA